MVHNKIRAALGVRGAVASGGGSLAQHLDDFYEAVGLPVVNGWGLTETSPVLACRRLAEGGNVRGTIGLPIPGTDIRIVDPETMRNVPDGRQGLLLARGPGVMQGYLDDEAATAKAFAAGDGWFDTGDLGWRVAGGVRGSRMAGHLVLTGRAKDTIVLTSGKNVEPQPIEDAIQVSRYIKHCVLLGHGHRALGALVTLEEEAIKERAEQQGKDALSHQETRSLIEEEIRAVMRERSSHNFKERIAAFAVLDRQLSVEDGTLTRTMKPRRAAIVEQFANQVAEVESHLR